MSDTPTTDAQTGTSENAPGEARRPRSEIMQEWAAIRRARGTQTEETRRRYRRTVESLIQEHGTLRRAMESLSDEVGPHMRLSTFFSIKAALRHHALTHDDTALLERVRELKLPRARIKTSREMRTRRVKTISDADLDIIIEHLYTAQERAEKMRAANPQVNPVWASRASLFLLATTLTGLRPSEWPTAQIISTPSGGPDDPDNHVLRVRTGKTLSETPRYRDIPISNLDDLDLIERHLHEIEVSGVSFETYYKRCKDRLSTANRVCFPDRKARISLYSGRNTFHARLIEQRFPKSLIAYLMGHAASSSVTSGRAYGRGGGAGFGPDYDPEQYREIGGDTEPAGTPETEGPSMDDGGSPSVRRPGNRGAEPR